MRRNSVYKIIVASFLAIPIAHAGNPNHLEPLDDGAGTLEDVILPHFDPGSFEVGMVGMPSFRMWYGVFIRKSERSDSQSAHYELLARGDLQPKQFSDPLIDTTISVPLSPILAKEIIRVWKKAIAQAMTFSDDRVRLDGTTYCFATGDSAYGKTWSPSFGIPWKLVDCSDNLVKYALAIAKDRAEIEANILQLCKELNDECEKEAARREEEK